MRDIRVALELEKVIALTIKEGENQEFKASEIVDEMLEIDKKNNSYLSTFEIEEYDLECIEEDLIFTLVKKAIDSFDPYFLFPDAPSDEYDGESKRIAEKIEAGMSIDEIYEIMKEEFNFSFSAKFTKEDFSQSAETVYNLLEDCINRVDTNRIKMEQAEYVYVKLLLSKVISIKILEKEDGRLENGVANAIKLVFDKIDTDKESESFLSSFNISVVGYRRYK